MSSNEHETNSKKKHFDKSQEASSTVVEPNRKNYLTGVWICVVYSYNAEQLAYDEQVRCA